MTTCTGFLEPLNLECIFVNVLSGNSLIFSILLLFGILLVAAYLRLVIAGVGVIIALAGLLFYAQAPWLTYLCIFIGGLLLAANITRMFK